MSQAASLGSNAVIELGLALFADIEVLGGWATRFAVVQTALYLTRAAASEPLLADRRPDDDLSAEPRAGAYLALSACVATALGVGIGIAGLVLGSGDLLLVAIAIPVVLAQDALRYLAFWSLRPKIAAVLDITWLAVGAIGLIAIARWPAEPAAIGVWTGGAAVSGALGLMLLRPRARGRALAWWRGTQALAAATLSDTAMYLASNQWLWFWLSATAGAAALGAYRIVILVSTPAMLVFLAAQTLIIPGISRRGDLPRSGRTVLAALPVAGLMLTAALAFLFERAPVGFETTGERISTATWVAAGSYVFASGIAGPLAAALRGFRRGRLLVTSRAASTLVTIGGAIVLVPRWETSGLLVAQATGLATFALLAAGPLVRKQPPAARDAQPGVGRRAAPSGTARDQLVPDGPDPVERLEWSSPIVE